MFQRTGALIREKITTVPYILGYIGRVFKSVFFFMNRERAAHKILTMQLLFTFIEALPIVVLLAVALGTGLYLVGYSFLQSIGQTSLIYRVLVIVITREFGPLLVAFVVTARSATAIATELGGMVTSHQIESYIATGVDPLSYLAAPRVIGVTASLFFLNLYFSLCGLLGPAVIVRIVNPVVAGDYISALLRELSVPIIATSLIKSIAFGIIISVVSTYYGFKVERSSTEVPIAGIQAVGNSFFGIILFDAFFIMLPYVL
jgi:phospholipid/cholesterol/gamma-HCH transport system permease protein